jgi:hypothetical protein
MSKISLAPDASGTGIFTIASPNSNTNRTLTLPDDTGTIVTNSGNQAGSFTTLNTSGAVVFNDAGADVDFRVEGDTEANLLVVDASADAVGIGTNSPSSLLTVSTSADDQDGVYFRRATAAHTFGIRGDNAGTLEWRAGGSYGGGGITMVGGLASSNPGIISFHSGTTSGGLQAERMRIDSSGNVGIGNDNTGSTNILKNFTTSHQVGSRGATINFGMDDGSFAGMSVVNAASSDPSYNAQSITFSTHLGGISSGECARITSIGRLKVSPNGFYNSVGASYHEFLSQTTNENIVFYGNSSASPYGNRIRFTSAAVKSSIIYMKAVKALQEAIERIETLEANTGIAALETGA